MKLQRKILNQTLVVLSLAVSACASTQVDLTPVNIEPVEKVQSAPFDPETTLAEADEDFSKENYRSALENYAKVYAFDTDRIVALLGQAKSHLALGEFEKAADIYWASDWTDNKEGTLKNLEIGKILSGLYTDRYDKPMKAINDGMMLSPNDARLWNAKGQYHDRRGEWMDALSAYLEAMKTGNWQAGTINNMGMSLLLQDRRSEARTKFEQALAIKPDSPVYDNNLRMVHILDGDIRTALKDLKEGRAANVLNDAGYVALKRNRPALAQRLFEKALEISPVFHAKAQANLEAIRKSESAARSKTPATSP